MNKSYEKKKLNTFSWFTMMITGVLPLFLFWTINELPIY